MRLSMYRVYTFKRGKKHAWNGPCPPAPTLAPACHIPVPIWWLHQSAPMIFLYGQITRFRSFVLAYPRLVEALFACVVHVVEEIAEG